MKPIRLDRLEWELVKQDGLMYNAVVNLTDAKEELDISEARLEVTGADLSLLIRNAPRKFGLKSCTEPGVKAAIQRHVKYRKAKYAVIRKKHKVGMMQAAVNQCDHRKKALEKAVDLHGQQYWSKPRPKDHLAERKLELKRKKRRRSNDD